MILNSGIPMHASFPAPPLGFHNENGRVASNLLGVSPAGGYKATRLRAGTSVKGFGSITGYYVIGDGMFTIPRISGNTFGLSVVINETYSQLTESPPDPYPDQFYSTTHPGIGGGYEVLLGDFTPRYSDSFGSSPGYNKNHIRYNIELREPSSFYTSVFKGLTKAGVPSSGHGLGAPFLARIADSYMLQESGLGIDRPLIDLISNNAQTFLNAATSEKTQLDAFEQGYGFGVDPETGEGTTVSINGTLKTVASMETEKIHEVKLLNKADAEAYEDTYIDHAAYESLTSPTLAQAIAAGDFLGYYGVAILCRNPYTTPFDFTINASVEVTYAGNYIERDPYMFPQWYATPQPPNLPTWPIDVSQIFPNSTSPTYDNRDIVLSPIKLT